MKIRTYHLLAALVVAAAPGCASSSSAGASQQATHRGSPDRITQEELATVDVQNALQAVQRLRPSFLQNRGGASSSITQGPQDVVVYVDQTKMGGPNTLAQIPISDVKEIQHLSGTDATQRYGTGHGSGVILVIRK